MFVDNRKENKEDEGEEEKKWRKKKKRGNRTFQLKQVGYDCLPKYGCIYVQRRKRKEEEERINDWLTDWMHACKVYVKRWKYRITHQMNVCLVNLFDKFREWTLSCMNRCRYYRKKTFDFRRVFICRSPDAKFIISFHIFDRQFVSFLSNQSSMLSNDWLSKQWDAMLDH